MSDQLSATLAALHERASDLQRTLNTAEEGGRMHNWPAALSHFQQLQQQLQLLIDRAGDGLLGYQAVQPAGLTAQPGTIPALLSTLRDPEREEVLQRIQETAGVPLPAGAAEAHNQTIQAVSANLARMAAAASLPGAGMLLAAGVRDGGESTEAEFAYKRQRRTH
eukprot:scaffold1375_cov96-Isochrysis_galbana.AAC.2